MRAARLLAAKAGVTDGVRMALRKSIPVAAGMAGGSADAAAALVACDALWGTGSSRAELDALAAELGSDVPFSLVGGTALGTGRGEQLSPVLSRGTYPWVFALADGELSTPAVYAELDRYREELPRPALWSHPDSCWPRCATAIPSALAQRSPTTCSARRSGSDRRCAGARGGTELGAVGALVSGSGPTCAFLTRDARRGRAAGGSSPARACAGGALRPRPGARGAGGPLRRPRRWSGRPDGQPRPAGPDPASARRSPSRASRTPRISPALVST